MQCIFRRWNNFQPGIIIDVWGSLQRAEKTALFLSVVALPAYHWVDQ